jgi:hypothetical protein
VVSKQDMMRHWSGALPAKKKNMSGLVAVYRDIGGPRSGKSLFSSDRELS